MSRPVTLFTGQWADMPIAELAPKAASWGYDGLELATWGDHMDIRRVLDEDGYAESQTQLLADNGLSLYAISCHLVGQAVADEQQLHGGGSLRPPVRADLGGPPQRMRPPVGRIPRSAAGTRGPLGRACGRPAVRGE